ncbi:protein C19orf12 homolog isoform X1 [Tyto alba]|uniref:protein C19orf12 homolog isoform X1 n=2 Tax=Tyto alba TaxID=56313 RepID=UPI001C66A81D|nr:protein C19orf12 homolog isoform X1 [Tyto alba]
MPVNVDDVVQLLCHISQLKRMKAAVKGSRAGALLVIPTALLGGLMAGPPGIAVGGACGGLIGAWMTAGKFKPVPQILWELSPAEKKKLYDKAIVILRNIHWTDIAQLTDLVMSNYDFQQKLLTLLTNYLTKDLGMKIQY